MYFGTLAKILFNMAPLTYLLNMYLCSYVLMTYLLNMYLCIYVYLRYVWHYAGS